MMLINLCMICSECSIVYWFAKIVTNWFCRFIRNCWRGIRYLGGKSNTPHSPSSMNCSRTGFILSKASRQNSWLLFNGWIKKISIDKAIFSTTIFKKRYIFWISVKLSVKLCVFSESFGTHTNTVKNVLSQMSSDEMSFVFSSLHIYIMWRTKK
jgi:hypothetical protein